MHATKGFSLVEVMLVVAILGIMAALAVPTLLPISQRSNLVGVAEQVASMAAEARTRAMSDSRCVRMYVSSTTPNTLTLERLNAFDCDDSAYAPVTTGNTPRIDATRPIWEKVRSSQIEGNRIELTVIYDAGNNYPTGLDEIRYRPTGRLWALNATTIKTDDIIMRVRHLDLPAAERDIEVLMESHGPVCVIPRGETAPNDGGGGRTCPGF